MTGFFGALSELFRKLETFTVYFTDRISDNYSVLSQNQKTLVVFGIIFLVLFTWYVLTIILRFNFKFKTRKLQNVRREYQITLNRAQGKRCNFLWDILLYQKMVILDDPLAEQVLVDENAPEQIEYQTFEV